MPLSPGHPCPPPLHGIRGWLPRFPHLQLPAINADDIHVIVFVILFGVPYLPTSDEKKVFVVVFMFEFVFVFWFLQPIPHNGDYDDFEFHYDRW